jgi:hypothetical protein
MTMKHEFVKMTGVLFLAAALLAGPALGRAAQPGSTQDDNGVFVLGSVLLSILHVPYKLVTCVGTQATAAVFYTATYDVRGHYDGGTNGKDIGETARRSCTGDWIITPSQVREDYGS